MTAPGGVIATVYVNVLPRIRDFSKELRQNLRASQRDLRSLDRELKPVEEGFRRIGAVATGIVPGLKLTRTALLAIGSKAVLGGVLATAAAATTMTGALIALPAAGAAAASIMGTLAIGVRGVEDALKDFDDVEDFNESLEELSENARDTLGVLNEFRSEINNFRDSIQDRLFAGMDDELRGLITDLLPMFETHFGNIADTVNAAGKDLAGFVRNAETMADVQEIMDNTELSVVNLRGALIPAAQAFRDIGVVGSRVLPDVTSELTQMVEKFAAFIAVTRATGQLETWLRMGIEQLKQLGRIATNVFRIFAALTGAAQAAGAGLLSTLEDATDRLADFLSSAEGQNSIQEFLGNARDAGSALLPVLSALADLLFMHVMPVFERFAITVGPAVAAFVRGLSNALDIAAPGIAAFATGFASFISSVTPALPVIGELVGQIAEFVGVLATEAGPAVADIASAIANVLLPIVKSLSDVVGFLGPEFIKIVTVIGTVVVILGALTTIVRGVMTVTGLFAGGLQLVASGAARTQGGLRGMIGFLSGPWGLALGAATVALGLFMSTTNDTTTQVNSLSDAMINATGSTEDASREWARNKLEQDGVAATAGKLRISMSELIDAYMGLPGAQENVSNKLRDNGNAANLNRSEFEALMDALKEGPGLFDAASEAVNRKADADYRGGGAVQFVTDALKIQQGVLEAVRHEEERQQNAKLASINSQLAYQNAIARTTDELAEGTRTLDINTDEGRQNVSALTELAAAGQRRVADLKAQKVSTDIVNATIKQNEAAILGLIQPFFKSAAAARKYAQDIGLIPRAPVTTPRFNDKQARAAAGNFNAYLNYVARDRVATIRFNARGNAQASGGIPTGGHDFATNATGGHLPAGRWSWVGEQGPELVRFASAARIYSNDDSMGMVRDVGALDTMTSRGAAGSAHGGTALSGPDSDQLQATINVQTNPEIRVFIDGKEVRATVQAEISENNRRLVSLIDVGTGRRT